MATGLVFVARELARYEGYWNWADMLEPERYRRLFSINSNLLLRTLALMFTFAFITAQGARMGDVILAANTRPVAVPSTSAITEAIATPSTFVLDLWFVIGLGMKVEGVAIASMISRWKKGIGTQQIPIPDMHGGATYDHKRHE